MSAVFNVLVKAVEITHCKDGDNWPFNNFCPKITLKVFAVVMYSC